MVTMKGIIVCFLTVLWLKERDDILSRYQLEIGENLGGVFTPFSPSPHTIGWFDFSGSVCASCLRFLQVLYNKEEN